MSEPIREILPESAQESHPEIPSAPMKWHGFLTRFMLFLAPLVHLLQAAWIFSGGMYYTSAVRDQVYAGIPGLRIVDYALAACLVIAALMQQFADARLRKLQWQGVKLLVGAYALLTLAQIAYAAARFFIAGLSPLNISVLAQALGYGALMLVNRAYYARRAGAFGKETK